MACYRKGGCGPYEYTPCGECPYSKPQDSPGVPGTLKRLRNDNDYLRAALAAAAAGQASLQKAWAEDIKALETVTNERNTAVEGWQYYSEQCDKLREEVKALREELERGAKIPGTGVPG